MNMWDSGLVAGSLIAFDQFGKINTEVEYEN